MDRIPAVFVCLGAFLRCELHQRIKYHHAQAGAENLLSVMYAWSIYCEKKKIRLAVLYNNVKTAYINEEY